MPASRRSPKVSLQPSYMRVIITGAAGRIGKEMVDELSGSHTVLLMDRRPVSGHPSIVADLSVTPGDSRWNRWWNFKACRWQEHFKGTDAVLHLAANPNPKAPWEQVLRDNIQSTWNVMNAAVQYRVPRVVFASSNWAVKALEQDLGPACYSPEGPKIGSETHPRPLTPYGVSKAMGEIIGRKFVDEKKLLAFVAVRIGSYRPTPPRDVVWRNLWIGSYDLRTLLRSCVERKIAGFHVVYGVSAQASAPYDLTHTCELLGWKPQEEMDSQSLQAAGGVVSTVSCLET